MLIWLLLRLQALSVFLLQSSWVFKQSADLLPDRSIRLVHAQLLVPTHPLEALPRNIHRSCTTVIRITLIVGASTISIPTFGVPTFFTCVFPAKQERKETISGAFEERTWLLKASLGCSETERKGLLRRLKRSRQLLDGSRANAYLEILLSHLIHELLP